MAEAKEKIAMIKEYETLTQGTPEWFDARRGLLTASEMKHIITPTLKVANNDKTRGHVWELAAQRITGFTEDSFVSFDMQRGQEDEIDARIAYMKNIAMVRTVGFITNNQWGFTLGYSPDGLIGDDGLIECKSRKQKFQIETIVTNTVPEEYMLQLQTALLITGRKWIDYVSWSGGLPMWVIRVQPDPATQAAILAAAGEFYKRVNEAHETYLERLSAAPKVIETERRIVEEMY
jgi:predicted phage-related endonuclease